MADISLGRGLNIGGWISQSTLNQEHIKSFFTREDALRIADWGFDNIRLPFDYPLIERDDNPGNYLEEGLEWMDKGIGWAREAGLKLILDMHHAPGFTFNEPDAGALLTDQTYRDRFHNIWRMLCRRYEGIREDLYFELLNEIVAPSAEIWNGIASEAVGKIREVDKDRVLVVGSNRWNAASTFSELALIPDPNIIYTFHFYEPFTFTHQKAGWSKTLKFHGLDVPYPGKPSMLLEKAAEAEAAGLADVAGDLRGFARTYANYEHGPETLTGNLENVLAFRKEHRVPVYCGEFGVIDTSPMEDRRRWHSDMLDLFKENGIDWSLWSYKGMNFGVVNDRGEVVDEGLLELLRTG